MRVEKPGIDEKESFFESFLEAKVLEKTLRSFPLVDGPYFSWNLRTRNQESVLIQENVRALSHGGYCIILAHQTRSCLNI